MMSRHLLALLVCFCTIALADPVRLAHGPALSPNARQIAFNSEREGSRLLYSMPAGGGEPQQLTFHTDGCNLCEWTPDGRGLLVGQGRDLAEDVVKRGKPKLIKACE